MDNLGVRVYVMISDGNIDVRGFTKRVVSDNRTLVGIIVICYSLIYY